ncbi:MAG: BON domain-containing protein [Ferrovum myxofaciens]|uniref:BON domain-containing protein n=1 Tax=Ferrovum myxofaciens TaxID=416213 RepID=UPI002357389A|nr:BON domain-containing protein [Ferrovum myxofaciens]QKE40641.1 MAG: BON domain-containing protein [Ferrovum myxofaciens]
MNKNQVKETVVGIRFAGALILVMGLLTPVFSYAVDSSTDTAGQYLDDATITTKVKASFAEDKGIKGRDISVRTDHGVVDLTGTVSSAKESAWATTLATHVESVKAVHNNLKVDSK